jgi:hypothetical protein
VDWSRGVDPSRPLLPLDDSAVAFPGASREQELALSQLMGLIINSTVSEMEDSLPRLKFDGWERILRNYPANPELWELGELFFEEEAKHARAFGRYLEKFCEASGIDRDDLEILLPKAFGSNFQRAITNNAATGGHAFWWVVASTEEISINIYHQIHRAKESVDPLYWQLHRKHLEEESRHANYAFLMLSLVENQPVSLQNALHRKMDFLFAQLVGAPWVVSELYKFFRVKEIAHKNPFFAVLASCIPLYEQMSLPEKLRRMFLSAPYISWFLNPHYRRLHRSAADRLGSFVPPFPVPRPATIGGARVEAKENIAGSDSEKKIKNLPPPTHRDSLWGSARRAASIFN